MCIHLEKKKISKALSEKCFSGSTDHFIHFNADTAFASLGTDMSGECQGHVVIVVLLVHYLPHLTAILPLHTETTIQLINSLHC